MAGRKSAVALWATSEGRKASDFRLQSSLGTTGLARLLGAGPQYQPRCPKKAKIKIKAKCGEKRPRVIWQKVEYVVEQ